MPSMPAPEPAPAPADGAPPHADLAASGGRHDAQRDQAHDAEVGAPAPADVTSSAIDGQAAGSVSSGPPTSPRDAPKAAGAEERRVVPVGPGRVIERPDVPSTELDEVNGYPIQLAKVQEPTLRDETLARDRLLDWLRAKIHHRVILVTAEAGYGKTTLLADFSRRSRQRTLWYRLDQGDGSWVTFLSYLIAAGREFDPSFAQMTASLLRELGPGGPSREAVVETFMRELGRLGDVPSALVIDDLHLVDNSDDVALIMRTLVERIPTRMTLILLSRRTPNVPLGRLRGQGEVAELSGSDLRFDDEEIDPRRP